jgi:hypothetical protein
MSETIFNTQQDSVSVGVVFTKIDEEKRTVSGFATLDNVDSHGDIIDAAASIDAFKRFRGGLREMHTNNAVGTVVSFEEAKKYYDEDKKVYTGVYITAKVSKGAQNTWEKVLDGTYKGFSIGGKIKKRDKLVSADGSETPVIKEYDLIEVSLVDNPANPLANVLTVRKVGDTFVYSDLEKAEPGSLSTGDFVSWNSSGGRARGRVTRISSSSTLNVPESSFSVEGTTDNPAALIRVYRDGEPTDTIVGHKFSALTKIDPIEKAQYNILYHTKTGDVVLSEKDQMDEFVNIGWAEENDVDTISRAIESYKVSVKERSEEDEEMTLVLHKSEILKALAQTIISKEVLSMATDTVEKEASEEVAAEEVIEKSEEAAEAVAEEEEVTEEVVEEESAEGDESDDEAEEADEESEEDADADDVVAKIQEVVTEAVAKAVEAANESKVAVEGIKTSFDETATTLNKEVSELREALSSITDRLKTVESETAVRKSSDILKDEEGDDEDESFWRGSGFLSANDLLKG